MKVSDAISESLMQQAFGSSTTYYRQKFERIIAQRSLAARQVPEDLSFVQHELLRTIDFNFWAIVLGPLWAAYRKIWWAWIWLILAAVSIVLEVGTKYDGAALGTWIGIGGNVLFGLLGNSMLLVRWLVSLSSESVDLAQQRIRPSYRMPAALLTGLLAASAGSVLAFGDRSALPVDHVDASKASESETPDSSLGQTAKWTLSEGIDPMTDKSFVVAASTWTDGPFSAEVKAKCSENSVLSYEFLTKMQDGSEAPMLVRADSEMGAYIPYLIRVDANEAQNAWMKRPRYNNQVLMLLDPNTPILRSWTRETIQAQTLTIKLFLTQGNMVIAIDQNDPQLREVVSKCSAFGPEAATPEPEAGMAEPSDKDDAGSPPSDEGNSIWAADSDPEIQPPPMNESEPE